MSTTNSKNLENDNGSAVLIESVTERLTGRSTHHVSIGQSEPEGLGFIWPKYEKRTNEFGDVETVPVFEHFQSGKKLVPDIDASNFTVPSMLKAGVPSVISPVQVYGVDKLSSALAVDAATASLQSKFEESLKPVEPSVEPSVEPQS